MKAAVIHAAGDLRIEEAALAPLSPDAVQVRVKAGGICGSDLHYYHDGGFGTVRLLQPMILGHEVAGVVEAVGASVEGLKAGDPVAVNPSLPCGACAYCLKGLANHCLDMRFYGSAMRTPHVQGAFREVLICKASQAVLLPSTLSLQSAAFAEPLAVALHALNRAGGVLGKRVLVIGAGPIGSLAALAAKRCGALEATACDLVEEPLKLLLGLGLDRVHNLKADPEALRPYGAEKGYFDVVFEASGSAKGLAAAVGAVRAGGAVVQIGLGGEIPAPMTAMVSKEVALLGSFRFHDEFAWAVRFIADGSIPVASLLTAVFPLSDAVEAFDLASDRRRAMKVQLSF